MREKGISCSTSMVDRIIRRLKDRGVLREPVANHILARKRPYAVRKSKDYKVVQPGDLIQLDTLDIDELKDKLLEWEQVYNGVRPHQALGYLTPLKFLKQWKHHKREMVMCH